jgi:membrane-bound lytic murein transglycosylase B
MVLHILAAASALTLFAADGGQIRITEAEVEAAQYGSILGAAAQCHNIDRQRVQDAMHHASLAVRALTSSVQEFQTARASFANAALTAGGRVSAGQESCASAEDDLKRIEKKFAGK